MRVHTGTHTDVPTLVADFVVDNLISLTVSDPPLLLGCSVHIGTSDVKFANPR